MSRTRQRQTLMQHARQRRSALVGTIACTETNAMSPTDVCAHRDTKQHAHGGSVLRALERSIAQVARQRSTAARRRAALETLIIAGELESALADANDPFERVVGEATCALAQAMLGTAVDLSICAEGLAHARGPRSLALRPHEAFAYDAIHPEAYAAASRAIDARHVIVIGTAGAGVTLSAVTAAALAARGATTERVTLRTGTNSVVHAAFRRAAANQAAVVIVEDVPSANDTALLEAAVAAGVPRERVYMLVGRSGRISPFRSLVAPSSSFGPVRAGTRRDLSAGAWRKLLFASESDWPAVCEASERSKFLYAGRLFKFEGLGSNGLGARHRASALAAEGIALDPREEGDGWTSYAWGGTPLKVGDLDAELLEHIARYIARRATLCPLISAETDLEPIVTNNVAALLGTPAPPLTLEVVRIATTDGQLMPHEWVRLDDGSVRKTDAVAHGDDRFLPGPTDVAYDLAGAIVEWRMDRQTRDYFLTKYRRASGDDASRRIEPWIIAYLTIRASLVVHALEHASAAEAERLRIQLERYRSQLASSLQRPA